MSSCTGGKMNWFLIILFVTATRSDSVYENLLLQENVAVADTNEICNNFEYAYNISEICAKQLQIVCENKTLLMTILDASGKFPYAGLTVSTRSDYGNFDQCLSVEHKEYHLEKKILGEYCTVGIMIPDILGDMTDQNSFYQLALCRPDGCSASDYNSIIGQAVYRNLSGIFIDGLCVTAESYKSHTPGDVIMVTVFAATIFIMFVASLYDFYTQAYEQNTPHPIILAFSVYSNGRKLLHVSTRSASKEQIELFYGMRVISMMWIVAGHGMAMLAAPVVNLETASNIRGKLSSFYMVGANMAVDTFFFMSGFLLAFQYFKGEAKSLKQQILSVPQQIVHRYLRLTPAMLMIFLVTITIYIHLGSGPLYVTMANYLSDACKTNWWKFLLYIQNYDDFNDMCLSQTWYLSADMQLFLVSPLIMIPLSVQLNKYGLRSAITGLLVLNIFFTVLPIVVQVIFRNYSNEYDTHSRFIDYFIGVMLGLFMRVMINKPFLYMINGKYRNIVNLVVWPLVLSVMFGVLIMYQDSEISYAGVDKTIYKALLRPIWCVGLSWITYSCYHGQGGFVNWILSRGLFQVLGRLTYCIYLVHVSVIMYYVGLIRTKFYFSEYNLFYTFCGNYVMSVIVALFWTLAFESPLIVVEKYLRGKRESVTKGVLQENASNEAGADAVDGDKFISTLGSQYRPYGI